MNKTLIFILLQACNALTMIGSSLITPFFPPFAIDKGLTQSILGYIISANPIGSFFASLALGKLITQDNRFKFIMTGIFLQGIGLFLFVGLNWIEDRMQLIILAAVSRLIGGLGTSLFMTPFYAYVPVLYPKDVEKKIGISEFVSGASQLIGPVFGSLLFGFGGYTLPFLVFGSCNFAIMPLLYLYLRTAVRKTATINQSSFITENFTERDQDSIIQPLRNLIQPQQKETQIPYTQAFLKYPVIMQFLMVFACNVCFTFFQPIIANFYLEQYGISEVTVGYLMSIVTAGYACGSYLTGFVKYRKREIVCVGCIFFGISYLFVGPDKKFTGVGHYLPVTLTSQALMGLATAPVYIPAVPLLNEFLKHYYPGQKLQTANVASAMYATIHITRFTSAMALGQLTGPIVSGNAADIFGFDRACALLGLFLIGLGILYIPMLFIKLDSLAKSGQEDLESQSIGQQAEAITESQQKLQKKNKKEQLVPD